jgi:pilus assembly protein CpaF
MIAELEAYLSDPAVTEILVNDKDSLWIEREGRLEEREGPWATENDHRQFVREILDLLNTDLSLHEPFCSGRVGDFRIQVAGPPVTEPVVSLRRLMPRSRPLNDWDDSRGRAEVLRRLVQEKKNIIVYGPTGGGKTTLLSSLLSEIGPCERVILLEDIEELVVPNRASLRLLSRADTGGVLKDITLSDLVRHSLRLRPDRLALGEVRGAEAKDLLMALATGHRGSFGTLHASSLHEALLRLEMLVQLGAPQWRPQSIRQLILLSVQALVGVKKNADGRRAVSDIHRLAGLEDFGFLTEPI